MVLPIGFFMPLPLAMMIPFMGIQSAVMAKSFGENFQFGKRRISALSNEEFNKLTPLKILEQNTRELKSMIPTMERSVAEMRTFQTFLIREFLRTLNDAIKAGFGELFGINQDTLSNIEHFIHGHGAGHDTTEPIPEPPPPTSPTSGGTVGGVTLPPTEIQQPEPVLKTDTWIIANHIGRVWSFKIGGVFWYRIEVRKSDGSHYTVGKNYTSTNSALSDAKLYWPLVSYTIKRIGGGYYFYLT